MPTLDDLTTLPKNLELAGNDNFAIADTSTGASSLMEQVPAALVSKYSHAFLFNFDSASVAIGSQFANIDVISFDGTQIVSSACAIVTKAFTGLGTDSVPKLNIGIHDLDSSGPDNIVDSLPLNTLGASLFNHNQDEASEAVLGPNGDVLRCVFSGGETSSTGINMSAATAGQVVILVNIIDIDDYIDLVPAFD